ncbi:MAG: hypothetical protein ABIO63_09305 [Casimicrobiaceae bacterium]
MPTKKKNSKKINVPLPLNPNEQYAGIADKVVSGKEQEVKVVKRTLPVAAEPYKFKPGQSGNPLGRPPDPVREIGKRIAGIKIHKTLKAEDRELAEQMGFDVNDITLLEHLMIGLATSRNPLKIELFLKRTFGNVPNININAEVNMQLVGRFKSKFTDSELEAIGDGASAMDILFDKLPDAEQDDGDVIDGHIT